jgi:hypothetical protein
MDKFFAPEEAQKYVTLNEVKGLPRYARGDSSPIQAQNDRKFSYLYLGVGQWNGMFS